MADSPWPVIHAHREDLAADLADLDQAGWDTPSLCAPWSVRDAFAYMTAAELAGDGVAALTARLDSGGPGA